MAPLQPRLLLPAAHRPPPRPQRRKTNFYDLPAELRIEVYKLALASVSIHILDTAAAPTPASPTTTRTTVTTTSPTSGTTAPPSSPSTPLRTPHPLILTSHQIRLEVLPLIQNSCPITATITDFDFSPLLLWLSNIPPTQERNLCKNSSLTIKLRTTSNNKKDKTSNSSPNFPSLKKWLHVRADKCRPQPKWRYMGQRPDGKTVSELKRKATRKGVVGEKRELVEMLKAIGVVVVDKSAEGSSESSV